MKRSVYVTVVLAITLVAASADRAALAQGGMFARAGYGTQPGPPPMRLAQTLPGRTMPTASQPEMLPSPPGAPEGRRVHQ